MKPVILASQSPRRKELLLRCIDSFLIDVANVDETINPNKEIEFEIIRLAKDKARAVFERHQDCIIVAADTMVVLNNTPLGKPNNREEAKDMLRTLSNNTHQVLTGLCIYDHNGPHTHLSVSDVTFRNLTEEEIEAYVNTGEADDKAGAYGIQGKGGCFITHIDGDYYGIMGLPIAKVATMLQEIRQ